MKGPDSRWQWRRQGLWLDRGVGDSVRAQRLSGRTFPGGHTSEAQGPTPAWCLGLKDKIARPLGAQYATGDQWRTNSRKNEGTEPKQKQHPVVDVTDDGNKV